MIKEGLQEGEESPLTGESLESLGPVSQSVKGKIPQSGHILIHNEEEKEKSVPDFGVIFPYLTRGLMPQISGNIYVSKI